MRTSNRQLRAFTLIEFALCDAHVEWVKRVKFTNAVATAHFFNIDHQPHLEAHAGQ